MGLTLFWGALAVAAGVDSAWVVTAVLGGLGVWTATRAWQDAAAAMTSLAQSLQGAGLRQNRVSRAATPKPVQASIAAPASRSDA
jgi:hypothetical protein